MNGSLPERILMTADAMGGVFFYTLSLAAGLAEKSVDELLRIYSNITKPDGQA